MSGLKREILVVILGVIVLLFAVSSTLQEEESQEETPSDYYSLLDLAHEASLEEVNERYKIIKEGYEKIQTLFQDETSEETLQEMGFNRNDLPLLTEQFAQMTKAYETLSNPERKQIYDQFFRIGIYLRKEWGWQDEDLEFIFNLLVGYGIAFIIIAFLLVIVGLLLIFLFGLMAWYLCCATPRRSSTLKEKLKNIEVEKDKAE